MDTSGLSAVMENQKYKDMDNEMKAGLKYLSFILQALTDISYYNTGIHSFKYNTPKVMQDF